MTYVCVVGSVNIDLTAYLPRWPERGETIPATDTRTGLGGKGANQAAAAARMGADVHLIGAVGADEFGGFCRAHLVDAGVNTALHDAPDCATGMAFIDVGPDGDNIIRLAHGANHGWDAAHLRQHRDLIAGCSVLLLQNEVPVEMSVLAAQIARVGGARVVMDPAPAPEVMWPQDVFAQFDIVTPNAQEAGLILGWTPRTLPEARKAAADLSAMGPGGAIVTMGGDGVAWTIDGQSGHFLPPPVNAIDTVGAGDCFNGAFAAALAAGQGVAAAIEWASTAASLATTREGAAASLPSRQEVIDCLTARAVA